MIVSADAVTKATDTPPLPVSLHLVSRFSRADFSWEKLFTRTEMLITTRMNRRLTFTFRGDRYPYCVESYNSAWHNERTVEVPIALQYLRWHRGRNVLEVGNVLRHYAPVEHVVVDKYERATGVVNADIVDYQGDGPYDLILSLSTLEHVGWEEEVDDWTKPIRAVDHLGHQLAPGGTLLVTFPLGYNPHVDKALRDNAFSFDEVRYLQRLSRTNHWRELDQVDVGAVRYGRPFPAANVVAVGFAIGRDTVRPASRFGCPSK